jgi:hypothetical protein
MPLSRFYRHFAIRTGFNVPNNALVQLNLASPRLRFAPNVTEYLRVARITALLTQLEAFVSTARRNTVQGEIDALCARATPPPGGTITGTAFHALCAELDAIVDAVVAEAAISTMGRRIVIAPPATATANPAFVRMVGRGRNVWFHYTDEAGFRAIMTGSRTLSSYRTDELRSGAKRYVYLTTPPHTYPPSVVHDIVFLGEPAYRERGDFLIAFATREPLAVADGTQPGEFLFEGSINLAGGDVALLYAGTNPFFEVKP